MEFSPQYYLYYLIGSLSLHSLAVPLYLFVMVVYIRYATEQFMIGNSMLVLQLAQ